MLRHGEMIDKMHKIPEGLRVYAIGDIHGYASALINMHAAIFQDLDSNPPDEAKIIYLGDYIDRGPDSSGVLDILVEASRNDQGVGRTFIRGNHESIALEFMEKNKKSSVIWLDTGWGGRETINSYGLSIPQDCECRDPCLQDLRNVFREAVKAKGHIEFLRGLSLKAEVGDYIFVHAGVHPDRPVHMQREADLTRIREPFLTHAGTFGGKRVVHGHSICMNGEPVIRHNRIAVDTGIYTYGVLTAAVLERAGVRFLQVTP